MGLVMKQALAGPGSGVNQDRIKGLSADDKRDQVARKTLECLATFLDVAISSLDVMEHQIASLRSQRRLKKLIQ